MLKALQADLAIIKQRDPAARGTLEILLCYPGLHALTLHRFSHWLWGQRLPPFPLAPLEGCCEQEHSLRLRRGADRHCCARAAAAAAQ